MDKSLRWVKLFFKKEDTNCNIRNQTGAIPTDPAAI